MSLGNRVSLLPYSVFCGGVARLNAAHGAGRAAAMSSAAHANFAGETRAKELLARLTDREREIVLSWQAPTTVHYCSDIVLDYASAEKEVTLGLDEYGYSCEPEDERCMSVGHMDLGWVRILDGADKVAFVGDIKKTAFASSEGADSLQLHAYAHAFASKHNCHAYCTGLWLAEEGEWAWSKDMVTMGSERQINLWERLYYAIQNTTGEYNSGAHCASCYSRLHCPEFALPLMTADSWLSPLNDLDTIAPAELGAMVLKIQSLEKVAGKIKEEIQERVRRGASSAEVDGKKWVPVKMPGRRSLDVGALREALGERLGAFEKTGSAYDQFRWICKKG